MNLFYRESVPNFEKVYTNLGNAHETTILDYIKVVKYKIFEDAIKSMGDIKNIDEFVMKMYTIGTHNSGVKLEHPGITSINDKQLQKNSSDKSNIPEYISNELEKIKKKNQIFLEYLSQTTYKEYVDILYKIYLNRDNPTKRVKIFNELFTLLFKDEEFLNFAEDNLKRIQSIGRVFHGDDFESIIKG